MIDINKIIFGKTQPQKKIDIINSLSKEELQNTSKDTLKRIIKDAGRTLPHSRNKRFDIYYDRQAGNNWNSNVSTFFYTKGKYYVDIYLQYENTDTSETELFDEFFSYGEYKGGIERDDRNGNPRTYYFTYSQDNKLEVIKSMLLEYVYTKYNKKLI